MSESRKCPQCGAELSADVPNAPCPACLIKLGLASWTERAGGESGQGWPPENRGVLLSRFCS